MDNMIDVKKLAIEAGLEDLVAYAPTAKKLLAFANLVVSKRDESEVIINDIKYVPDTSRADNFNFYNPCGGESNEKSEYLRERLVVFTEELKSDYNRPEGRWGMHGHSCVDDDYFEALDYVIKKLDALLSEDDMTTNS